MFGEMTSFDFSGEEYPCFDASSPARVRSTWYLLQAVQCFATVHQGIAEPLHFDRSDLHRFA